MKNQMKSFWICAAIRAGHTCAQTALAMIGTSVMFQEVNWAAVASASVLAGVVSLLKSIVVGLPEVDQL